MVSFYTSSGDFCSLASLHSGTSSSERIPWPFRSNNLSTLVISSPLFYEGPASYAEPCLTGLLLLECPSTSSSCSSSSSFRSLSRLLSEALFSLLLRFPLIFMDLRLFFPNGLRRGSTGGMGGLFSSSVLWLRSSGAMLVLSPWRGCKRSDCDVTMS